MVRNWKWKYLQGLLGSASFAVFILVKQKHCLKASLEKACTCSPFSWFLIRGNCWWLLTIMWTAPCRFILYIELTSIPLVRKERLSRGSDFINIYITSRPPALPTFPTLSNSVCEFSKTVFWMTFMFWTKCASSKGPFLREGNTNLMDKLFRTTISCSDWHKLFSQSSFNCFVTNAPAGEPGQLGTMLLTCYASDLQDKQRWRGWSSLRQGWPSPTFF